MKIRIDQIRVGKRLRSLSNEVVDDLSGSIGEFGLRHPVTVVSGAEPREGGGQDIVCYELVAGHHRLEACRRLGWSEIEASVELMTAAQRRLWEIDENLKRKELSELERGEHLALRKPAYEDAHPETKHATGADLVQKRWGNTGDNLSSVSFAADTATKTGIDQRTVQRSIRRAKQIDPKIRDRIRDNLEIADNGSELDALAGLPVEKQIRAVALVESEAAKSVREAVKIMDRKAPAIVPHFKAAAEAEEKQFLALMKAWNAAGQSVRERFMAAVDQPVADNSAALRVV